MKLKKGVTGFWKANGDYTATQIDEKTLKKRAYECDHSTHFKLKNILNPDTTSNYYRLLFIHKITGREIDVIINCHYPFYTGITSDSKWMHMKFVDLPNEIKEYFNKNFICLAPKLLGTEFTTEDLSELFETETNQINYWNSKTYGEVIFNRYD